MKGTGRESTGYPNEKPWHTLSLYGFREQERSKARMHHRDHQFELRLVSRSEPAYYRPGVVHMGCSADSGDSITIAHRMRGIKVDESTTVEGQLEHPSPESRCHTHAPVASWWFIPLRRAPWMAPGHHQGGRRRQTLAQRQTLRHVAQYTPRGSLRGDPKRLLFIPARPGIFCYPRPVHGLPHIPRRDPRAIWLNSRSDTAQLISRNRLLLRQLCTNMPG